MVPSTETDVDLVLSLFLL